MRLPHVPHYSLTHVPGNLYLASRSFYTPAMYINSSGRWFPYSNTPQILILASSPLLLVAKETSSINSGGFLYEDKLVQIPWTEVLLRRHIGDKI